ncbi:MAG: hypothetical protein CVV31_14050 [Methanomicrobiales archaeon HGW-Methanomicrobiales-2]|nr:MAG: hypothetical protein CVV31_14050 [Methanomicrobiales archaeon HGW-Methanomicrobiales-2]
MEAPPTPAGIVIAATGCWGVALAGGRGGAPVPPPPSFMKPPPVQVRDDDAARMTDEFIRGLRDD